MSAALTTLLVSLNQFKILDTNTTLPFRFSHAFGRTVLIKLKLINSIKNFRQKYVKLKALGKLCLIPICFSWRGGSTSK